ncbi:MAG: hypothetical protein IBX63_10860 [Coriobacteriia bacterium]|nr:hypothetical protein [Coriobacteriia bacterium]
MSVEDFEALPQRVFLDSCTLQTLRDYGYFIWEGELIAADDQIHAIPDGLANVEALRSIFDINERAPFEWILSEGSLDEAFDKRDPGHLQWAYDVLDHTLACLEESGGPTVQAESLAQVVMSTRFEYLSAKDRRLIHDAVRLGCDAFLTMERRLPRNSEHLERELGLRVLRPCEHWALLQPWASLYK